MGWATVKILTGSGLHVFASVRRPGDAERLSAEFGNRVTPLLFDVTDEGAVAKAAERVAGEIGSGTLLGLVNNAGIAVGGPLMHLPVDDFRRQIEVNLLGPLIVTQAFLPLLGAVRSRSRSSRPGRVVNVSSVAGKSGAPFLGAYAASKHGLEGFSESLRRELMLYGIDVIIVAPGSVTTPIWDKAESADVSRGDQTDYGPALREFRDYAIEYGRNGLPPEQIGRVIWKALTASRPHTRYAPVPRKLTNWWIPRLLPKRLLDRLMAKRLGLLNSKKPGS
ncbi:MAG: SDR family NAD(P)-dependent oxidoreductase [bacterium]|nr:SDR family NAD(P)-dependent oxidoreductase [bacterium]